MSKAVISPRIFIFVTQFYTLGHILFVWEISIPTPFCTALRLFMFWTNITVLLPIHRDRSGSVLGQWEVTLHNNDSSRWPEYSLITHTPCSLFLWFILWDICLNHNVRLTFNWSWTSIAITKPVICYHWKDELGYHSLIFPWNICVSYEYETR